MAPPEHPPEPPTPKSPGTGAGEFRLSVVVPAYQAGDKIASTIEGLRQALAGVHDDGGVEILVVDDGSSDGTGQAAEAGGADRVLILPVNRGKGAAVRAGMLAAKGRAIAFTDADLSYSPDQLLRLLTAVEEGWDVVVGSRAHDDTNILMRGRRLREVTGRVFNLLTRRVLKGRYLDTQCGLKAFRADVARSIFSRARIDRFAFDVEMFHLAERSGLSVLEVPVDLTNSRSSTVRIGVESTRMVRDVARIRRWERQGLYDLPAGASPPAELGSEP